MNNGNGHLNNDGALPQARIIDLVTREMPDELLVYDLKRQKAHCLNQTAALVWKHCDGTRTVAEIAGLIGQDLNTTVDEAAVWLAIERLGKAHLLEQRVSPPAGSPRLSRREAVRRLGLGASLAMPVVISIIAPTAASAQTCAGNNRPNGCTCAGNGDCASMCCGFSVDPGDVCVSVGSVPVGGNCERNCECAGTSMCNSGGMCAL